MRAESEYARCGTLAYLAAYDVHRTKVIGRCEPTTGIKPFTALVDQVMAAEPYASARRVFWVVDNGAAHRNWAAAACGARIREFGCDLLLLVRAHGCQAAISYCLMSPSSTCFRRIWCSARLICGGGVWA